MKCIAPTREIRLDVHFNVRAFVSSPPSFKMLSREPKLGVDAADPIPTFDDPRFENDYEAYRRAYKAWHGRDARRRRKAGLNADADGKKKAAIAAQPTRLVSR